MSTDPLRLARLAQTIAPVRGLDRDTWEEVTTSGDVVSSPVTGNPLVDEYDPAWLDDERLAEALEEMHDEVFPPRSPTPSEIAAERAAAAEAAEAARARRAAARAARKG